ncbi:hypothetical protein FVE85_6011 [Porphyridium purpureum]|uniref:Uncharacterized protein n=1 Tax=Porphyridium purpureum TaxID=35688 RepID=A0A5J4Z458_PORPP|nr:hypothetical protein FVE85_6011 [Porphyridium purpureum]|eukprot:POR8759..scf295_1
MIFAIRTDKPLNRWHEMGNGGGGGGRSNVFGVCGRMASVQTGRRLPPLAFVSGAETGYALNAGTRTARRATCARVIEYGRSWDPSLVRHRARGQRARSWLPCVTVVSCSESEGDSDDDQDSEDCVRPFVHPEVGYVLQPDELQQIWEDEPETKQLHVVLFGASQSPLCRKMLAVYVDTVKGYVVEGGDEPGRARGREPGQLIQFSVADLSRPQLRTLAERELGIRTESALVVYLDGELIVRLPLDDADLSELQTYCAGIVRGFGKLRQNSTTEDLESVQVAT